MEDNTGCIAVIITFVVFAIITLCLCMIPTTHTREEYELACLRVNDSNFYLSGSFIYIEGQTYSTYVFYIKKGNELVRYEVKTTQCRILLKSNEKKVVITSSEHPSIDESQTRYTFYLDEKYISDKITIQ